MVAFASIRRAGSMRVRTFRPGCRRAQKNRLAITTARLPPSIRRRIGDTNHVSPLASRAVTPGANPDAFAVDLPTSPTPAGTDVGPRGICSARHGAHGAIVNQLESGTSSIVLRFCAGVRRRASGRDEGIDGEVVEESTSQGWVRAASRCRRRGDRVVVVAASCVDASSPPDGGEQV